MAAAAAPPHAALKRRRRNAYALVLAAAALLSLAPCARAACSFDAPMPDAGTNVVAATTWPGAANSPLPNSGLCPPFAASPSNLAGATCGAITVQPNAVLAFGTCGLPGAACTGATRLTLTSSAGATLVDINRASATSFTLSFAKLAQGCILGARCSWGEWRNTALSPANVTILERCFGGDTSCTGIAAWRVTNPATPALQATAVTTTAAVKVDKPTPVTIAFVVTPARNASLTKITGTAPAGAPVSISIMPFSAYNAGAAGMASLGNSTDWAGNWTTLYNSSWPGAGTASIQQVTFGTPFPVVLGTNYTVMVSTNNVSATALGCLHWLGNVTTPLYADSTLTVYQGGSFAWPAFNFNNTVLSGKVCAWQKLSLSYDLDGSCAPPPPPPLPPPIAIPTTAPAALVASLDDLMRALANTAVTSIDIRAAIRLNSTLTIAVDPGVARTLVILGTSACNIADQRVLLCSLDAGGLSSVMTVPNNVSLTIGNLAVSNGVSALAASGGCILADCSTCSLTISAAVFTNCTARTTGNGGAIIMRNGGSLTVRNSLFQQNTAAHGGAIMVFNATASISSTTFAYNTATLVSTSTVVVAAADLTGPSGGGLSLEVATATVTACTFSNNLAMSTDFVLVANPDLPQARGGGLFISTSPASIVVSGSTFSGNQAYYGGGVYAFSSSQLQLLTSVLSNNTASLGDGGGIYMQDCGNATIADSLIVGNTAGGHMGGGVAAFNSLSTNLLTVVRSSVTFNSAPSGCGGGLGFDTPLTLIINQSTVISGNTARSGGGLCCNLCKRIDLQNSFLFNNAATLGGGGAMSVSISPSYLVNVSMTFNSAPQGGAIYSTASYFKLENSSLANNTATATHGGAILHDAVDDGKQDLILLWSNFTGNGCEGGGGAVAAFSTRTLVLNNCNLQYNSIYGDHPMGGALMALSVTRMFMRNSTVSYNKIAVVPTLNATSSPLGFLASVDAIGSGNGGALWIGSALRMPIAIVGCTFQGNRAPSAGSIYVTGNVRLDVQLCSFFHDHASDYASRGGSIVSAQSSTVDVADTIFFSCEANGGGVAWHGGTSASTYTRVMFEENEGIAGADMKGTVLQIAESAFVNITDSTFLNNIGVDLAEGTIAFVGDSSSSLYITDSLFDGNFAYLGGCLFTTVDSQADQLSISGVTFTNSFAFAGSVLFTEAVDFAPLDCSPDPCDTEVENFASNYGQIYATPPTQFNIDIPESIRSGAPLPVVITLVDGFGTLVTDWTNTVATIETLADVSGSLRTFYQHGQATFADLVLRGAESQLYNMTFSISGPKLFGNDVDSQSATKMVEVLACDQGLGETYDTVARECVCAAGYGLIKADNTCRMCGDNEVVPDGELECVSCPVLSVPVSPTECECLPGYFGAITGASGICTLCPEDSFRSVNDSAVQCVACPESSHTFHLGAVSEAECLCSADTWNDQSGVNGSLYCAAVPLGGWAPEGDTRMFALADHWRPDGEYPEFFPCTVGMCKREEPLENATTPIGHSCRPGHTGHLCAVCIEHWSYQGAYCGSCDPAQSYQNWSAAKRGGLVFIGLAIILVAVYFIFFLPLSPRLDDFLRNLISPATTKLEKMLGDVAKSARPASAGGVRPASAKAAGKREERKSHAQGARFQIPQTHDDRGADSSFASPAPRLRVHRRSRILVFLDLIQEPIRIVITFWQIISSFSANLYVPWPSIYYSLSNALNVVSLDFLRLPDIACLDPGVQHYTVFNGITITTFIYIVFCMLTYYYGARSAVALENIERRRRFKTQCLNAFIWGVFLVYPQVSATTLSIFACDNLENGTSWLMADYRLQCYTPTHRLYIGVGALWTLLLPFGLPASFVYLLYQAGVPELSKWKRNCGWLRAIAQRALVLGVPMDGLEFDPDTLTLESISTTHLRLLHRVFVNHELAAILEDKARPSVSGPSAVTERTLAEALKEHLPKLRLASIRLAAKDAEAAPQDAGANRSGSGGEHTRFDLSSPRTKPQRQSNKTLWEEALARRERMQTIFAKIRIQLGVAAAMKNRGIRRRLSQLFYRNERELLIMQLLDWAKHDKATLVAEPRHNQLRWRTHYEWHSLRVDNVQLSDRDQAERNAFFKYRFLFAAYAVHAWYWEAVDMGQKLFLVSIIGFIAPRSSVQIIVATMFAFGMTLFAIAVKPYRERANNQLVALSQVNLFLFLFTGLLLRTNPDGISEHHTLFAVLVGALTTSIVAFSFFLFLRELSRQLLNALIDIQDDEDADEEAALVAEEDEWTDESFTDDEDDEEDGDDDSYRGSALALRSPLEEEEVALASGFVPEGDYATDPQLASGGASDAEDGGGAAAGQQDAGGEDVPAPRAASPPEGTPPPPAWVSRLAQ